MDVGKSKITCQDETQVRPHNQCEYSLTCLNDKSELTKDDVELMCLYMKMNNRTYNI